MIDAAIKALEQMVSPPFRTVLLKIRRPCNVVPGGARDRARLAADLAHRRRRQWFETTLGPAAHWPVVVLGWALAIALGLGVVVGVIFLMPAVTSLVAGFFR
jgi:hypothetical protein